MKLAAYFRLCGPYRQGSVSAQMLAWWQFWQNITNLFNRFMFLRALEEGSTWEDLYKTSLLLRFPAVSKSSELKEIHPAALQLS